jgi:PKD repeat protein
VKAKDLVVVEVWNSSLGEFGEWVDITNGVISIDTVIGDDTFQGFWEQFDTGQFKIVTRGSTADPNINSAIKTNSLITVRTIGDPGYRRYIFMGFISELNVDYIKGQKQIVTINGTDLIGQLNRLIITQDYIDSNIIPTYPDCIVPMDFLVQDAPFFLSPDIANFFEIFYSTAEYSRIGGGLDSTITQEAPPAPLVKVEVGKTIYELIKDGASTGLITYLQQYTQIYQFIPYIKYDYSYYYPEFIPDRLISPIAYFKTNANDPWQEDIETYGSDLTFRSIRMNNGINKIVNQVSVNNTNPITQDTLLIDPVIDADSTLNYGPAKLEGITTFTDTQNSFLLPTSTIAAQAAEYQNAVLQYQSTPKSNIEAITVDSVYTATIDETTVNDIQLGNTVYVQHKIDSDNYIYGTYTVCGIKNIINESNWSTEYILRDADYNFVSSKQPKQPIISVNHTSGTTATTFNASISNYTTQELNDLQSIEWMVNLPMFFRPTLPPSQIKQSYYDFSSAHIFNEQTASWIYSDTGILAGYPEEFRGPGIYNVAVWVTNSDGYTSSGLLTSYINNEDGLIQISGTTAHADFLYTIDSDGGVHLSDTSGADATSWSWNFGDGTTYNGQNPPTKYYNTAGTYNITLTVSNGDSTDSEVKPITVSYRPLAVKYVRLRYQTTATKAAGSNTWSSNMIDTLGLVELKNDSGQQTGGIQPMYITPRTIEKVRDIGKGNKFIWAKMLDAYKPSPYPMTYSFHRQWIQCASPLATNNEWFAYTTYTPYYTTDYSNTGPLYPMSQTYREVWNEMTPRGTMGGIEPKFKFYPVITTNPDGSQTRTLDVDIIVDYSKTYTTGTADGTTSSVYRKFTNNKQAGYGPGQLTEPYAVSYLPSGRPASMANWDQWDSGATPDYNQKYKLKEVKVWPGSTKSIPASTAYTTIIGDYGQVVDHCLNQPSTVIDQYGLMNGTGYQTISISVSEDGVTYRKIGEAAYTGDTATLTTTYNVPMPPYSNAPIEA